MNYCLAQIILVAGNSDGEDTFWMQMLVFVILVALWGIYSLVKTRANKFEEQQRYYPAGVRSRGGQPHRQNKALKELKDMSVGIFLKTAQPKVIIEGGVFDFEAADTASQEKVKKKLGKERDLHSGMEMLELDFLLSIVRNTEGDNKNNVMMRKLVFNELLRREQLGVVDSNALKVYAINDGNLYGKDIQCEAMKKLAERTLHLGRGMVLV